jgi:hypothetical protein
MQRVINRFESISILSLNQASCKSFKDENDKIFSEGLSSQQLLRCPPPEHDASRDGNFFTLLRNVFFLWKFLCSFSGLNFLWAARGVMFLFNCFFVC